MTRFWLIKNARFYKYGIAVFVLITILAGYSLYLGKEALVKEAVKLLGVLGAGWIGGYHWGKRSAGKFAFPCGIKLLLIVSKRLASDPAAAEN